MRFPIIGVMSGTSLDGIDLAFTIFTFENNSWEFECKHTSTIPYEKQWKEKLESAPELSGKSLIQLHYEYGLYLGDIIQLFIEKHSLENCIISSHGHTIFHEPDKKLTFQLGDSSAIKYKTARTVISDFRKLDVFYGGEGAPLVPIGDKYLFPEHASCLNLGGMANISFMHENKVLAFDVCPFNFVFNFIAQKCGKPYDKNGDIAKSGKIDDFLLKKLNNLPYYKDFTPKSLSREWVEKEILPLTEKYDSSIFLNTFIYHTVFQIQRITTHFSLENILLTGGGTYNVFFVSELKKIKGLKVCIPSKEIIEFKEAIIFGFLGILKQKEKINTLRSVTGAKKDSIGGTIC